MQTPFLIALTLRGLQNQSVYAEVVCLSGLYRSFLSLCYRKSYVQKNGVGRYEVLADSVTLDAAATLLFDADGTTLIIHATADDDITDPAGNAGARIACGVVVK